MCWFRIVFQGALKINLLPDRIDFFFPLSSKFQPRKKKCNPLLIVQDWPGVVYSVVGGWKSWRGISSSFRSFPYIYIYCWWINPSFVMRIESRIRKRLGSCCPRPDLFVRWQVHRLIYVMNVGARIECWCSSRLSLTARIKYRYIYMGYSRCHHQTIHSNDRGLSRRTWLTRNQLDDQSKNPVWLRRDDVLMVYRFTIMLKERNKESFKTVQ